jgi:DNA-binding Xre family transcriptional regulator
MLVRDNAKLAALMAYRGVSARQLAEAAGWRTHTYLLRLLNGEVRSLRTDPALRIAHHLDVAVGDLFVTRVSSDAGQVGKSGAAA